MEYIIDHVVLNVKQTDVMVSFYRSFLGLLPIKCKDGKNTYPSLRLNGLTSLELYPPPMWTKEAINGDGQSSLHHISLVLAQNWWEDLIGRLKAAGVKIIEGPKRHEGARGQGVAFMFKDPEGNRIEALYYPEQPNETGGPK